MDRLELSSVLNRLREEIAEASKASIKSDLRFEIQDVELEIQIVVTKEQNAGGKTSFWVLEANAGSKYANAVTQKVKLKLKASNDSLPVPVADEDSLPVPVADEDNLPVPVADKDKK
jgi:hypothetical protein